MLVTVLVALFLLGTGVLAGVLIAVERAVVPMLRALHGERWVEVHRLLDPGFDPLMPRMNKATLAAGVALVILDGPLAARTAFGLSAAGVVGVALVSELRNIPINRRIDTWEPADLPADWRSQRARWLDANRLRTLSAIVSFAAAIGGALFTWA